MQLIFLPKLWTILLCFALWPMLQVMAALICLYLPDRFFSGNFFLFRTYSFEKEEKLYEDDFMEFRENCICKREGQSPVEIDTIIEFVKEVDAMKIENKLRVKKNLC